MVRRRKTLSNDGCTGCNVANTALIVPLHKMKEEDFKKMGIDYWTSDFSDVFSNGT
ncbi:MAG: hypothetical protein ACXV2E_07215 [Halobacteriota archaeon]